MKSFNNQLANITKIQSVNFTIIVHMISKLTDNQMANLTELSNSVNFTDAIFVKLTVISISIHNMQYFVLTN